MPDLTPHARRCLERLEVDFGHPIDCVRKRQGDTVLFRCAGVEYVLWPIPAGEQDSAALVSLHKS